MDVLEAAWHAAGCPVPDDVTFGGFGLCARCGRHLAVTGDAVVSAKWTGWSDWGTAVRPTLCAACTWGYRNPSHRQGALLVTAAPAATALGPQQLVHALAGPLAADQAVVLPLHRGRKHVLPTAVWGRLCVDDAALVWTATEARRLQVVLRLRELGVTGSELGRSAPPYRVVASTLNRGEVMALWPELTAWRPQTPWLAAAVLVAGLAVNAGVAA